MEAVIRNKGSEVRRAIRRIAGEKKMISKYKYTIVFLIFAAFTILGSMEVMKYILQIRETQLLTENGRVEMQSPVRTWESLENDKDGAVSEEVSGERNVLKIEQIEDAIKCWNNRNSLILHEPVAGQIPMEEAIDAGEKWLIEMGMREEKDAAAYTVNAELGIGMQTEEAGEQLEAYYSFWTVTYSNQSMNVILYINAVTGKIWGAEISLYEELPERCPDDGLWLFVELAGLQVSDDDSYVIDSGKSRTEIAIKESQLYARKQSYSMVIGLETSYIYTSYQLLIK